MDKNWLIRTKNNHILGPVSKKKVKELVENGSVKGDDEVCSGNGYWFYIREKELVNRYLFGEESQTFNPVSEANTVLACLEQQKSPPEGEGNKKLPAENDLEYPDNDVTTVGLQLGDLGLSENETEEAIASEKDEILSSPVKKKSNLAASATKSKNFMNDKVLYLGAFALLVIAIAAFLYRKSIIEKVINSSINFVIPSAYAQIDPSGPEKKNTI